MLHLACIQSVRQQLVAGFCKRSLHKECITHSFVLIGIFHGHEEDQLILLAFFLYLAKECNQRIEVVAMMPCRHGRGLESRERAEREKEKGSI